MEKSKKKIPVQMLMPNDYSGLLEYFKTMSFLFV